MDFDFQLGVIKKVAFIVKATFSKRLMSRPEISLH